MILGHMYFYNYIIDLQQFILIQMMICIAFQKCIFTLIPTCIRHDNILLMIYHNILIICNIDSSRVFTMIYFK